MLDRIHACLLKDLDSRWNFILETRIERERPYSRMLDNTTIALKIRFSFTNSSCDYDHLKLNFLSYGNQILGISFQLGTLQWKDNTLAKTGLTEEFDRWSDFSLCSWFGKCQIHIESFRWGLHKPWDLMSTLDVLTDILNKCLGHPFVLIILECELRTISVRDPPLMWDGHWFLSQVQPTVPLLRSILSAMVKPYLTKNPTAVAALDLIRKHDGGPICYDHFAFRTFGVSQGPSTIHTNTPFSSYAKQEVKGFGLITLWTNCRSMDAGSMLCPKYSLILVTRFATSFGFPPRSCVLCGSPLRIICLTWRAVRQMGHCPVSSYLKSMCMSSAVNHRWELHKFGYCIKLGIVSFGYRITKILISSSEFGVGAKVTGGQSDNSLSH